jgi:hypothetical protein
MSSGIGARVGLMGCAYASASEPRESLHRGADYLSLGFEAVCLAVGRVFYGASTLVCAPVSRDREVGLALGAQVGEQRLREVITAGGFPSVRRATETSFNIVLEARP